MLLLASRSPRRRALLKAAGVPFLAQSPRFVEETPRPGETPPSLVLRLAIEKAQAVANSRPGHWVLGCDTEVVWKGRVLGKPRDRAQARRMLTALARRTHTVLSGIALIDPQGRLRARSRVFSRVTFGPIPRVELERYLRTSEPYDKAGGYGIQGQAARWVTSLEGDYFNVMGLPVSRVLQVMIHLGILQKRPRPKS